MLHSYHAIDFLVGLSSETVTQGVSGDIPLKESPGQPQC